MAYPFLDFLDRHAIGFFYVATVLPKNREPLLRDRGRPMHDQMRVWNTAVDFLDAPDGEDFARGLARELVRAVRGANRDGQGIDTRALDEIDTLLRVGEKLIVRELAFCPATVLFPRHAGFERTEAAQLAFHRHTNRMRHIGGRRAGLPRLARI